MILFCQKICFLSENFFISLRSVGAMAERLGTGLQNLVQRFDSASHLKTAPRIALRAILLNMLFAQSSKK